MSKVPIPAHWFSRQILAGHVGHPTLDSPTLVLGFCVSFPGATPRDARLWLKSHGYAYLGGEWIRSDRGPSRLDYARYQQHRRLVTSRIRRRSRHPHVTPPRFAWTRHRDGGWSAHEYRLVKGPVGWRVLRDGDLWDRIQTLEPAKRACERDRSRRLLK